MAVDRIDSPVRAVISIVAQKSSLILALLGILVSIGLYHISKGATVPIWALFYVLIGWVISVYLLLDALRLVIRDKPGFPQVLAVVDNSGASEPILLTEPSDLFGTGSLVSIYYREPINSFEVLLAHGAVRTIQLDTKVQIEIEEWEPGNDVAQGGVRRQEPDALRRLIIRPSVSRERGTDSSVQPNWDAIVSILESFHTTPESPPDA